MPPSPLNYSALGELIKAWGAQLGFAHTAISDVDLGEAEQHLAAWLARGFHGEMAYMSKHGRKRTQPARLVADTVRVITVRMDYLPQRMDAAQAALSDSHIGYISRYALGRDYHKVMRRKLQKLAQRITREAGAFGYRAFCDSAPVMEKALAQKSGHGWIGKHTNLLNRTSGSWFFLGELYTDLPLPVDAPVGAHCGSCTACLDICPTDAIVAPYQLDARRCISYLTIELHGAIPVPLRKAVGNRIFGCDDCQLVCPWNRYARLASQADFAIRHRLDARALTELFAWDERDFKRFTEGSAIRRIGHIRWLRNIAVALGNASNARAGDAVISALRSRRAHPHPLVREHVDWALAQHAEPGRGGE
ncbi:MAG: tRNA epoxyqueuosine(34) reductase QueG [Gammaproteobacteria bacterium]|nr:tRNA epoxyqueuosine(34) reductase QueG [Gammaproteobacteria bacterium]